MRATLSWKQLERQAHRRPCGWPWGGRRPGRNEGPHLSFGPACRRP
ncbi:hypothetical protein ACFFX0_31910 [Citricoccus parietis]|uniref:Uncharacterized protein n=1 Tax=Citricoccus parietis TaxID=592307 RepID=A0ABV5G979_9MICC